MAWTVGATSAVVVACVLVAAVALIWLAIASDEIGLVDCPRAAGVHHDC